MKDIGSDFYNNKEPQKHFKSQNNLQLQLRGKHFLSCPASITIK